MTTTPEPNDLADPIPGAIGEFKFSVPVDLPDLDRHIRRTEVGVTHISQGAAFIAERVRDDERIEVRSLEQHLPNPLRQRGNTVIHDWTDFAQLVNRLHHPYHTTMYADVDKGQVVAVLDDHAAEGVAGWRGHRAVLQLQADPDWTMWMQHNGKLIAQPSFANLLEELAHTVIEPDAATMIEVATQFRATRKADFASDINIQNGDVQLTWSEETTASAGSRTKSGRLEVPKEFTVRVAPWRGVDPVDLTARLRYDVEQGRLHLGVALLRPDRAKDDAFALILARLRENVVEDVPLFKGVAPAEQAAPSAG